MHQRNHYATLDGLRGFAALSVVIFHISTWFSVQLSANGWLAVELFFCLSGYVLSLAYASRFRSGMSPLNFLILRLIRLMPMILVAVVIASSYQFFRIQVKHENVTVTSLMIATTLAVLCVPYLSAPFAIGGSQIFPLNGPQWSLFFELVVNVAWMALLRLNQTRMAIGSAVVCFTLLILCGSLGGDSPATFWTGFPRVGSSFFAGMVLYQMEGKFRNYRFWSPVFCISFGLMVVLFYYPVSVPFSVQILWIALISPMLVISAAHVRLGTILRPPALISGELSYPIYALHYPVFQWLNGIYQVVNHNRNIWVEVPLFVVIIILFSNTVLVFIDKPIRKRLEIALKNR